MSMTLYSPKVREATGSCFAHDYTSYRMNMQQAVARNWSLSLFLVWGHCAVYAYPAIWGKSVACGKKGSPWKQGMSVATGAAHGSRGLSVGTQAAGEYRKVRGDRGYPEIRASPGNGAAFMSWTAAGNKALTTGP